MISPANQLVREVRPCDRSWIEGTIRNSWGDAYVVVHDEVFWPAELPGLIALDPDQKPAGLLTYQIRGEICELVTLDSQREGLGLGSALLETLHELARGAGCRTIVLTTTNDNQHAIDFYQNRGFRIKARRQGAVDRARARKPSIPEYSRDGIPIHDELDLELILE